MRGNGLGREETVGRQCLERSLFGKTDLSWEIVDGGHGREMPLREGPLAEGKGSSCGTEMPRA